MIAQSAPHMMLMGLMAAATGLLGVDPVLAVPSGFSSEVTSDVRTLTVESRRDLKVKQVGVTGGKEGYGTWFSGMGTPRGGCGVSPDKAVDDNGKPLPFVALNTNSEFSGGANCGRWISISLGNNCVGGGNSVWSACNGGRMEPDERTGDVIYGYIMDSCGDQNMWCQDDFNHLDISQSYLDDLGLTSNSLFNARKVHWNYMDSAPEGWSMSAPKYQWMEGSKWKGFEFWMAVVVYNVDNGISRVEQNVNGGWQELSQIEDLGNNFQLVRPNNGQNKEPLTIAVYDVDGVSYGEVTLPLGCADGSTCGSDQDVSP